MAELTVYIQVRCAACGRNLPVTKVTQNRDEDPELSVQPCRCAAAREKE